MNNVVLIGNLCRDNELRYTTGDNAVAILRNTLAVQRKYKDKASGKYESDFIPIQAFGNNAEFIDKYFQKGSKIAITGHIQTGSYTNKDGNKVYTTDVIVDSSEFVQSKGSSEETAKSVIPDPPAGDETELPFD